MKTELEIAYSRFKSRTQDVKEFVGQLEDFTNRISVESLKLELKQKINAFKRKMEI